MSDRRVAMDIGEARSLAFSYETIEIGLGGLADDISARACENPLLATLGGMAGRLREWEAEVRAGGREIASTADILEGLEHTYETSADLAADLPPMPASMLGRSTEELAEIYRSGSEEERAQALTALLLKASADPEVASLVIDEIGAAAYRAELDERILARTSGAPGAEEQLALWAAPLITLSLAVDDDSDAEGQLATVLGTDRPPTGPFDDPMPTPERLGRLVAFGGWGDRVLLGMIDYAFANRRYLTTSSSWGFFRGAVSQVSTTRSGALDLVEWALGVSGEPGDGGRRIDRMVEMADRIGADGWTVDSALAASFDVAFEPAPGHPMFASGDNPYVRDPTLDAFDASVELMWQRQQDLVFDFEHHVAATGPASLAGPAMRVAGARAIYLHDPGMRYARQQDGLASGSVEKVVAALGTEPRALGVLMAGAAYASARETYQCIMTGEPTAIRAGEDIAARTNGFADALDGMHVPVEMRGLEGLVFGPPTQGVGAPLARAPAEAAGHIGEYTVGASLDWVVEWIEHGMGYGVDPRPGLITGRDYRELVVLGAEVGGAQMMTQFDIALANAYLAGDSASFGDSSYRDFEQWDTEALRIDDIFSGDLDRLAGEESRLDDVMSREVLGTGVPDGTPQQEAIRERAAELRGTVLDAVR